MFEWILIDHRSIVRIVLRHLYFVVLHACRRKVRTVIRVKKKRSNFASESESWTNPELRVLITLQKRENKEHLRLSAYSDLGKEGKERSG